MKYDSNASFFQSIKETNNKQCLKKYIIISLENGQLTQLLLQSDSRQVAMEWSL